MTIFFVFGMLAVFGLPMIRFYVAVVDRFLAPDIFEIETRLEEIEKRINKNIV